MATSIGSKGSLRVGDLDVTSAGTAEALDTGLVASVTIVAKDNNTGRVFVGGDDVASTTHRGLLAGDAVSFNAPRAKTLDLADIYIDTTVSGDGVDFYAV